MAENKTQNQARGVARKAALIQAVVRILARDGVAGVTHRAVAAEAGAKHGSARYYFKTQAEMVREALDTIVLEQAEQIRSLLQDYAEQSDDDLISALAKHVCQRIENNRESELARYELFLAAARTGEFKSTLDAWEQSYVEWLTQRTQSVGKEHSTAQMTWLLNLINGLVLRQLAAPQPDFEKAVLIPALRASFEAAAER